METMDLTHKIIRLSRVHVMHLIESFVHNQAHWILLTPPTCCLSHAFTSHATLHSFRCITRITLRIALPLRFSMVQLQVQCQITYALVKQTVRPRIS